MFTKRKVHSGEMQHRVVICDVVEKSVIIFNAVTRNARQNRIDIKKQMVEIEKVNPKTRNEKERINFQR
jgi:uncharacterized membrane protein